MALVLQQSRITQQSLISVGSIVSIKGRSTKYRVKAISKDRSSAWIISTDGYIRWPLSELFFESQLDLFEVAA